MYSEESISSLIHKVQKMDNIKSKWFSLSNFTFFFLLSSYLVYGNLGGLFLNALVEFMYKKIVEICVVLLNLNWSVLSLLIMSHDAAWEVKVGLSPKVKDFSLHDLLGLGIRA